MTSTATADRTTVGIIFGGRSPEHSISLITAHGVLGVLDRTRYEPVLIGITEDGSWHLSSLEELEGLISSEALAHFPGEGPRVTLPMGAGRGIILQDSREGLREGPALDVVLPLLHGSFGEDGTVQGLLEMADLPYVGAGVAASAIGMDKHFMKMAFESAGLAVGPYRVITARDWDREREESIARVRELGLPVFVKPARAGSSQGITRIDDWSELDAAIAVAQACDPKVVVEEGISGREIECAVLDGRSHARPRASLPGEVEVLGRDHAFYDFEAKYVETESSRLRCPADLPEEVTEEIRREAVRAFLAIGGEGLARADFFYADDGRVLINEINTLPGFTPSSMYRVMWGATGLEYGELVDELLELALERPIGLR